MNLEQLLENRYSAMLQWGECFSGMKAEGDIIPAAVKMTTTVDQCILMQRYVTMRMAFNGTLSDEELLASFIEVHFAKVVTNN